MSRIVSVNQIVPVTESICAALDSKAAGLCMIVSHWSGESEDNFIDDLSVGLANGQFAWDFVKEEVMNLFRQFHETGRFVRSLNATFLVLIPKKGGTEDLKDLKDFRPISLVGGLYIWLAKVLANRLKGVLAKVISLSQMLFVEGRQIMDVVLITNEAIDSILKSNNGAILCKLDIEKAYDHVDWSFLLAVLGKMGFGGRWCSWIKWCLSTVSFLVLVNGSPTGFFQGSRGLRKGDPHSPYLFIIVMEAFSCLMKRAVAGAKEDQLTHLCWLLMWFEALSGLKVNMDESELIPVGMPLGAPFKSIGVWDGIEERFRKRLAIWKRQYISKGGMITLIRSGSLEQKPHIVRWPIVCENKSKGGLGVKSLGLFNKALLGKWSWRFANEKKALWNQVIRKKYGKEIGGWRSCEIREVYGVGLWKAINKVGQLVTPFFGFEVGDGKNVRFWKDKWCGTSPLSETFPSLFALATSKEAWVNEVWTAASDRRGSWTPTFNRLFNDWEMEEVGRLLCYLEGKMVRVDEEDRVSWVNSKDEIGCKRGVGFWQIGVFFVKSVRSRLTTFSFIAKNKGGVDFVPLFRWSFLGFFAFGEGNSHRLERLLCGQEKEGGMAFGAVMLVLVPCIILLLVKNLASKAALDSKAAGLCVLVSHWSGELEDNFIDDLSVGLASGQDFPLETEQNIYSLPTIESSVVENYPFRKVHEHKKKSLGSGGIALMVGGGILYGLLPSFLVIQRSSIAAEERPQSLALDPTLRFMSRRIPTACHVKFKKISLKNVPPRNQNPNKCKMYTMVEVQLARNNNHLLWRLTILAQRLNPFELPLKLQDWTKMVPFAEASSLSIIISYNEENLLGEGFLGSVYKAKFPNGQVLPELHMHLQASST
ncbi:Transposon TX1 uncharacterized 149 kDa protein [Vitis vinifera]|uniref:phosphopyruvate hydratase n=1 Tax=Vitis vinifera TaxID=29760 RepID=A0A438H343_VITVI|nr:Transposon TX1 uncharacterized 149 kDa protein [Vitis vinifera]